MDGVFGWEVNPEEPLAYDILEAYLVEMQDFWEGVHHGVKMCQLQRDAISIAATQIATLQE